MDQATQWTQEADAALAHAAEFRRRARHAEELAVLESAAQRFPQSIRVALELAGTFVEGGRYAEALAEAERGLALPHPRRNPQWRYGLLVNGGIAAQHLGRLDLAVAYLSDAQEHSPHDPHAPLHLGRALAALGAWSRAARSLVRSIAIAGRAPYPETIVTCACDTLAHEACMAAATQEDAPIAHAVRALTAHARARAKALLLEVLAAPAASERARDAAIVLLALRFRDTVRH